MAREVRLEGVPKPAQIARYSPDGGLLVVSSLNSNMLSFIDTSSGAQAAVRVGDQPMDFAFRGDELFVGCQGDGTMHVIDIPNRRHKQVSRPVRAANPSDSFKRNTARHWPKSSSR